MGSPVWRSVWLRGAISAVILAYLISGIDVAAAWAAVAQVDTLLILAVLGLVGVDRSVMIGRWLLVLRGSGQQVAVKSVAWIFLVSSFIGSALPASVGGDAARAYTLSRRTDDTSEAVASVAIDRLFGILSLAVLAVIGALLWGSVRDALPIGIVWTAAGLVVAGCGSVFWADRLLRRLLPASWHDKRVAVALVGLADALSRYRGRRATLAGVFVLSVIVQLLRVVQAYLLGLGLGIDVTLGYYLVVMPVGLLMLLLPVSVAGVGAPQGVIMWLLRPQGVPNDLSFALTTLIILTGLAGNLPGAWLYARSKR
ncbi:MAG: lysylphosphatidylglycerol synthase transmembrane domain-containing protein [Acidobacteriota bacterium]|nr:lysylphosphatidylglycerol synthase transmembrane domain-containing protein [Acidobacteriota bacterium]